MKRLLSLLGLLIVALNSFAQTFTVGDLTYNVTSTTNKIVQVSDGKTAIGAVVVPETVTYNDVEYSVRVIGSSAFERNKYITSVSMSSVTNIGSSAFYGCTSLTSVSVPAVTSIGSSAFYRCTSLTSANLPVARSIGGSAFYGCTSLTSVSVPAVTSIGSSAFLSCSNITSLRIGSIEQWLNINFDSSYSNPLACSSNTNSIDLYIGNSETPATGIEAPNIVAEIPDYAFAHTTITAFSAPTVMYIGTRAFENCKSLESVNLPAATSIGEHAFSDCTYLNSVNIPVATSIGRWAFSSCSYLASINLSAATSIGEYAFLYCSRITSLRIGNIEQWCNINFEGSAYDSHPLYATSKPVDLYIGDSEIVAKNIEIPATVTKIPSSAFEGTTITTISAPSVTSIGNYAFKNCTSLTSVDLPSVTSTYNAEFRDLTSLSFVNLPAVTSVAGNTFSGCTSLSSIDLPVATSIGDDAFYKCSSLSSIEFPVATTIGSSAFCNCTSLSSIDLPVVTSVGSWAFARTSLLSVNLAKVTSIKAKTFMECTSLVSVNLAAATSVETNAFYNCTSLSTVDLPVVTSIGSGAFGGCFSLSAISLPFVKTIDSNAFGECSKISSLRIGSVEQWLGVEINTNPNSHPLFATLKSVDLYIGDSEAPVTSLEIPSTVTMIPAYAFKGTTITSVSAPAVTSIGSSAFYGCSSLSALSLPVIKTINSKAFYNCTNISSLHISSMEQWLGVDASADSSSHPLYSTSKQVDLYIGESDMPVKNIEVPSTFTMIPAYAFKGTTITSISAPAVTSIGSSAFYECSSLSAMILPVIKTINSKAFYNCTNISSLHISSLEQWLGIGISTDPGSHPLSATSKFVDLYIGDSVTPLTNVEVPNTVNEIPNYAFNGCYSITTLYIPNSVTKVGSSAFAGCTGLTSITCEGITPPTVSNSDAFSSVPKTIPLYVPREGINAYKENSVWNEFFIQAIPEYEVYLDDKTNLTGTEHVIPIYMNNIMEICNLQFDIVLPEKVDIYYGENDDEEEVYWVTKGERAKTAHTVAVSQNAANTYRVIISSTSNAVFKNADRSLPIAYVRLNIDKYISGGSHKIELKNIKQTSYNDGVTSLINVPDASGEIIAPQPYSVIVSSSNTTYGTVKVEGGMFDANTQKTYFNSPVTMTSTPKTGYHFVEWTENGVTLSTENPYTLSSVTANHTIKGVFAPNMYAVTFIVDGEVYSTGSQAYGSIVVTPGKPVKTGYSFVGWKNLTSSTRVPANAVTYEAVFSINKYTVKFVADGQVIYEQKQDYNSDIILPTAPEKEHYAFVNWGDVLDKVPAHDVTYTADYVLVGDLYEDQEINIGDLTELVGIILDAAPDELDPHVFKKADIYQDNKINVADYTSLVGMILHGSSSSAKARVSSNNGIGEVALNMNDFRMTSKQEGSLSICLNNPYQSVAAIQFDIELPSGISFDGTNALTKSSVLKQSVSYKLLNDRTLRVMVYSPNNSVIRESNLMNINLSSIVDGDYEIIMKNIVCSTANNNVKELENIVYRINSSEATTVNSIDSNGLSVKVENSTMIISSQTETIVNVVSTTGKLVAHDNVNRNKEMRISLPMGIYLVNGVKYIVK